MVTNSYLFELICEWRRWAGQRGKLLVLLIGFAIVCALLTLSLRFGQILLNANPAWLNSDNFFYTLAHQHDDGRQAPVNKLVIQTAVELPDVDQASWLSFKNVPLESSTWPIRDPLVAFYSDSFFSMTGISDMPVAEQSSGVWISERFWLEELNASPSVVGERFHHERIPHSLVVTGVLPESLNKLGSWQPDIWVPGDYLRFTTPFDANSHTMVDRFLTAVPIYFGILSSERQLNEESLNERLSAKDFAVPGMSFTTEGAVLNVYRGIELAPIERANMLAQWRLLIFLVIGLGIVLAFNTFMVFTSRFLIYQKDYQVMQVVGATPKYQLGSALFVAAAKLVVIAVISLVLLVVLERIISQHPTYKALQGDMSLGINYLQWLASWMLTSLVFLVCFLTPLIKISKKEMFDRAMGASSSKMRKLGAQGNLTLQLTVALVSLNMALTFALYQWQIMTDATVDVSTQSVNVSQRGTGLATRSLTEGGVSAIEKGEVAVSFAPFEQPQTIAITIPNSPQQVSFDAHYVSRNYFEVLKVTTLAGDDAWQSGVRINQAAADILGSTASGTDLIGKSINIGSIYGQPQVTGIVDNLPHRGRASAGAPMIYFSVEASAHTPQRSTFFFNDANKTRVSQALTTWLNQEMIDPVLSDPLSIAEVLAREDQAVNSLFASTVLISALIIASVLISLGYQIKARLRVDRHEYGVLLAIGAPPQSLLLRVLRHTFIAFAVAVPLAVFVLAVATSKLQAGSALPVSFVPLVFILACFVTLLLTIVTASVPLRRILREPIFSYLRQG